MIDKIKKIALAFGLASLLFLPMPVQAKSKLIDGQHHYYTVQMRSDKKAIVYAKMVFINDGDEEQTTYQFSVPDSLKLNDFSIQQIVHKKKQCILPMTYEQWRQEHRYGNYDSYKRNIPCLEYADQEIIDEDYDFKNNTRFYYYGWYYDDDQQKYDYDDLELDRNDNQYKIKLAHPIKPGKQGAVFVSYHTDGYVTNNMGWYDYKFKNFIVDDMIEQADVAINFSPDVYARYTSKQTLNEPSVDGLKAGGITNEAIKDSYQSDSQDRKHNRAGSGGYIQKSFKDLLPKDVISVSGKYVNARWKMYLKEILITLIVVILMIGGSWLIAKKLKKRKKKEAPVKIQSNDELVVVEDVEEISILKLISVNWLIMLLVGLLGIPFALLRYSFSPYYDSIDLAEIAKSAVGVWIIIWVIALIAELILCLFKIATEGYKKTVVRGVIILAVSQFLTLLVVFGLMMMFARA